MSWPEVEEIKKQTDVAIIPVGSTEQHGLHLPLKTDAFIAYELAKLAAQKVPVVVTPPIFYGESSHHLDFPGTISINSSTLVSLTKDVAKSLVRHGFKKIIILNAHGGNTHILQTAANEIHQETQAFVALVDWWTIASDEVMKIKTSPIWHACELETSIMLALDSSSVDLSKAVKQIPSALSKFIKYDFAAGEPRARVAWPNVKKVSGSGVIGDPTKASIEKGEKIVNKVVERLVTLITELLAK